MPIPKAAHPVVCDLCGIDVNPIMSRYLFFLAGWRGRPTPKPHRTTSATFCGPCGDLLLERVGPLLGRAAQAAVAK